MSEVNKGLSGRKRRLGAIHGIICLAVTFFVALSAKANAKEVTYLSCMVDGEEYFLRYEIGEEYSGISSGHYLKYFSSEIPNCTNLEKGYQQEDHVSLSCSRNAEKPYLGPKTLTINRMTGKIEIIEGFDLSTNGHRGKVWAGVCRKAKQKF